MTLIIETGAGIRGANAYTNAQYVTSYLTFRNRHTENGWNTANSTLQEAAIIAATDYIEKRFGSKFKGTKKVIFDPVYALASMSFSGLPTAGQTFLLGDQTYKFVSSLTGVANEILIGSTATITADNVAAAVNGASGAGVLYGAATALSRFATALAAAGVVTLTATTPGPSGALTIFSGTVTNAVLTAFTGGEDGGDQPLSWPRVGAYMKTGSEILGVPDLVKQAVSEYAVRALSKALLSDPTIESYQGSIVERNVEVGPIVETYKYDSGSVGRVNFVPYPAADALLAPLLNGSSNRLIRG